MRSDKNTVLPLFLLLFPRLKTKSLQKECGIPVLLHAVRRSLILPIRCSVSSYSVLPGNNYLFALQRMQRPCALYGVVKICNRQTKFGSGKGQTRQDVFQNHLHWHVFEWHVIDI